jgi:orotate phosphoribosyltransferase-like protein
MRNIMVMHKNIDGEIFYLSKAEEKAVRDELKISKEKSKYLNQRKDKYKTPSEYLDMIWNTIDKGDSLDKNSDFYLHIKSVNDEFPEK